MLGPNECCFLDFLVVSKQWNLCLGGQCFIIMTVLIGYTTQELGCWLWGLFEAINECAQQLFCNPIIKQIMGKVWLFFQVFKDALLPQAIFLSTKNIYCIFNIQCNLSCPPTEIFSIHPLDPSSAAVLYNCPSYKYFINLSKNYDIYTSTEYDTV